MTLTPEVAHLAQRLRPAAPPARPLRIFFWAASEEDGTWIYRVKMPADELRRLGHEVQAGTRMGAWGREADIIVGQRVCQVLPSRLWQMLAAERRAHGLGGMVFEVDDDLFNIHEKSNRLGAVFRHPTIQANLKANLRAADGITVSTAPLADVVRKVRGGDPAAVHVVPNAVRTEALTTVRRSPPGRYSVLYGWQGSSTHGLDWKVAADAVAAVLQRTPSRMRFLGVAHPEGLPLDRGRIDGLPWTTDIAEHYARVAEFDVSLAPLANTQFNRSKSALRVQESLALGVPVVASDVPSYRGWVEDGVTGFIVPASTRRWIEAMVALQEPEARAAMSAAGRKAAAAWTIEASIGRWLDAYYAILER